MLKQWYHRFSKRTRQLIVVAGGLIIVAIITYFFSPFYGNSVPSEFNTGRESASVIAKDVVILLQETADNLKEIQKLEGQNRWKEALNIVYVEIDKNKSISQKALELTQKLEIMAKAVPDIEPGRAREMAIVAISSEVSLVTTLNSYINGDLNQLLSLLRDRLIGKQGSHEALNDLVDVMNQKRDSINSLNDQFVKIMTEFDNQYQ